MKTIFPFLILLSLVVDPLKIDFGADKGGQDWRVVNDGVMGGLSEGKANFTESSILFKGTVSLDNNGGFSSLRSDFSNKKISKYSQVKIRYRSTGISLAMTLSVSQRWYVPNYKVSLSGTKGVWKTVTFNLNDFRKHYIGKPMDEMLEEDTLKNIIRFGFITDQKKYGDFEFEIDYLEFL